jgi:hypothetical protein
MGTQIFAEKTDQFSKSEKDLPEIPLNPPFSKGETVPLPLLKGGWEGFLRWLDNSKT